MDIILKNLSHICLFFVPFNYGADVHLWHSVLLCFWAYFDRFRCNRSKATHRFLTSLTMPSKHLMRQKVEPQKQLLGLQCCVAEPGYTDTSERHTCLTRRLDRRFLSKYPITKLTAPGSRTCVFLSITNDVHGGMCVEKKISSPIVWLW